MIQKEFSVHYSHYVIFTRRFLKGALKGIIITGERFGVCSLEQALEYKLKLEATPGILEVDIKKV